MYDILYLISVRHRLFVDKPGRIEKRSD